MPPYNRRRQPQDTRLWKKSPKMNRRSTLQARGSLGYRDAGGDSFSSGLRTRLIITRDRDGGNGGSGGYGDDDDDDDGEQDGGSSFPGTDDSPDDRGRSDGPGDSSDDDSGSGSDNDGMDSDGDDSDDDSYDKPQVTRLSTISTTTTSSSGSIVTLTPLVSSQVTATQATITSLPVLPTSTLVVLAPASPSSYPDQGVYPPTTDRKEEGEMNTIPPSLTMNTQSTPTWTSTPMTTATTSWIGNPQFDMDGDGDDDNDGGKHKWHGNKAPPPGGLDPTAEHLLIAAGSIGTFILFCFLGWILYRVLKRTKGQGVGVSGGKGFIDKFNWKRREPMEGTLDSRTMYMANEAPPLYEKGEYGNMQSGTFYDPTKAYPPGPGSIARSVASNSEGTLRQIPNNNPTLTSIINQYPPGDESGTLRSQAPQPYYNESDLPRQPPDGYNPPQRIGNRASALSSISSGFGDGDIIVPPPLAANDSMPTKTPDNQADDLVDSRAARESWMDREDGRRETVYTTTSEDRPARFRSITSWVNQQAGRVKRAGSRARDRGEIPVMPAIPGEISTIRQTAYR
ncbi:hypothetical protein F5Y06DRAFT_198926 [Hypoxylon sp. FL0890]|nr:hypothetical protein F5Y06DRAFT_198926 [Hypoxylon sp. FL0890]